MERGATGRFEITRAGGEEVRAFVPNPLPPQPPIELDSSQQRLLERATLEEKRLAMEDEIEQTARSTRREHARLGENQGLGAVTNAHHFLFIEEVRWPRRRRKRQRRRRLPP